jgi:CHAD domain-containing protein
MVKQSVPTAGEVFRAVFGDCVRTLVARDEAIRTGRDPEALHDGRVAVRKMRSYLRAFGRILEEPWSCGLRDRLAWLNEAFAGARDLDVLIETLEQRSGRLPLADRARAGAVLERLHRERTQRREVLQAALRSERYADLTAEAASAADRPNFNDRAAEPACGAMYGLVRASWKRVRKAIRAAEKPPTDAQLHAIRKKTKHLRFIAELFEPFGGKRARALARCSEAVQDVLGDQHDAVVAMLRLRQLAGEPDAAFVAGELTELSNLAALGKRKAWRKACEKMRRACRRLSRQRVYASRPEERRPVHSTL